MIALDSYDAVPGRPAYRRDRARTPSIPPGDDELFRAYRRASVADLAFDLHAAHLKREAAFRARRRARR